MRFGKRSATLKFHGVASSVQFETMKREYCRSAGQCQNCRLRLINPPWSQRIWIFTSATRCKKIKRRVLCGWRMLFFLIICYSFHGLNIVIAMNAVRSLQRFNDFYFSTAVLSLVSTFSLWIVTARACCNDLNQFVCEWHVWKCSCCTVA